MNLLVLASANAITLLIGSGGPADGNTPRAAISHPVKLVPVITLRSEPEH